jgi:peptidoglycan-N-acetylglucosamine deacetylase
MTCKRRGHLVIWGIGSASGGLVIATIALWTGPRWLAPRVAARAPGCVYTVHTLSRAVALTIDDGPARETPEILRVLREHDAHATFFLISTRVPGQETIVNDIVADGHEIGNHMTRDEPSIRMKPAAFDTAAREAGAVLQQFAPVRWLRPGSGWYTPTMIATMERAGYRCALGSIYPFDAQLPSSAFASAYIRANARPGAVIVLHDGGSRGRRTAETLQRILPVLRTRGYRVVSLSELERIAADAKANEPTRSSPAPSPSR